jgi:hypothetical protein
VLLSEGLVPAGTYQAAAFRARSGPDGYAGPLLITLPDGWSVVSDRGSELLLQPADAEPAPEGWWPSQVRIAARPVALTVDPADPCRPIVDRAAGTDVDGLVAALLAQPGLAVEFGLEITVGGFPARLLDVRVLPDAPRCAAVADSGPVVPLFADAEQIAADGSIGEGWAYGMGGYPGLEQDPLRLLLVDLGVDDVLLIVVDAMRPEEQDAFVERAMPIVESLAVRD